MRTQRLDYIDIAKSFAIIAVVFGHIGFQYPELKLFPIQTLFATLWHVPVFFMIGGFFIKEERLANPLQFIKGKFLNLYLPTMYVYIPAVLLHNAFINIDFYSTDIEYGGKFVTVWDLKDYAVGVIKTILFAGREPLMGAMWFAYVLFMALCMITILFWICKKITNKHNIKLFAILLLTGGVIASIFTNKYGITIPRCNNVFTAAWLIFCGMMIRQKYDIKFENTFWFVVSLISFYSFGVLRGGVALNGNNFDDIVSLTLSSLSALYVICYISKKIRCRLSNIMCWIGKDSFWIMGLHFLGFKVCVIILNLLGGQYELAKLCPECGANVLLLLYYLAGGVFIPLLCVKLVRKIFQKTSK